MKILAIVSARGGSKGIPRKNLKSLGGKPLISYMLGKALSIDLIDKVICSTDDKEIAHVAKSLGAEVPELRPVDLADDNIPLIAATQYAMKQMDKEGFCADIIVQLAPTGPFVKREHIEEAIGYVKKGVCDCAVSLKQIEHEHPYRARKLLKDNYFENFIQDINVEAIHSRQDLPKLYCTSGSVYVRKRHLLENYDGSDFALGKKRKGVVLDDIESTNIDNLIDFKFAEFLIEKGYAAKYI